MCFSAEASFATGAALFITGIASIKNITEKKQLVFASIPIIFSIQQFSEGFLWLSLTNPSYLEWNASFTHLFLFIAQIVWSSWVPLAFLLIEKDKRRKRILLMISGLGISLSLYLLYCLFNYNVSSEINGHHIFYDIDYPIRNNYGQIFYFIPTVFPAFISKVKWASILGLLNLSSFIVAKLLFNEHVISVWCFMAAVISVTIYIIMREIRKKENLRPFVREKAS